VPLDSPLIDAILWIWYNPNQSVTAGNTVMATPHQQLDAMRALTDNWDGYDAARPLHTVIELGHEFVALIEAVLRSPSQPVNVSPTRAGGVLIEWAIANTEHEIQINSDRSIDFLHRDRTSGEIESRSFAPDQVVVHPGFLDELREALAA
jgi:hypothetical protein